MFVEVKVLGEGYPRTLGIIHIHSYWIPTTHTDHCRVRMTDGIEHTITMNYREFALAVGHTMGTRVNT